MGKTKKVIAGIVVTTLVVTGTVTGLNILKQQNVRTVQVCRVEDLTETYYPDDEGGTELDGSITANVSQKIRLSDKDMVLDQVYVSKGDTVHVGDQLMSFDTTIAEMKLQLEKLQLQQVEMEMNTVLNQLAVLYNGGSVEQAEAIAQSGSGSGAGSVTIDEYDGDSDSTDTGDSDADDSDFDDSDFDDEASISSGSPGSLLASAWTPAALLAADIFVAGDGGAAPVEFSDGGADLGIEFEQEFDGDDSGSDGSGFDYQDALSNYGDFGGQDDGGSYGGDEEYAEGSSDDQQSEGEDGVDEGSDSGEAGTGDDSAVQPDEGGFSTDPVFVSGNGTQDLFVSSGEGNGYAPWLDNQSSDIVMTDVAIQEGSDVKLVSNDAQFYQVLDWDSHPYSGSGTKADPYVFLCSCSGGKVTATGGFLNIMAGYDQGGLNMIAPGGYWYRLEFHQYDMLQDSSDRQLSCIGFYVVDGAMLTRPVDPFVTTEFALESASGLQDTDRKGAASEEYDDSEEGYSSDGDSSDEEDSSEGETDDEEGEDDGDEVDEEDDDLEDDDFSDLDDDFDTDSDSDSDSGFDSDFDSAGSGSSAADYVKLLEDTVRSLDLSLTERELSIEKQEKKVAQKTLYSKLDGVVSYVGSTGDSTKDFMTIKSSQGYYIRASVSELMLDSVQPGAILNCDDWQAGVKFKATVMEVSDYPVSQEMNYGFGSGNTNVSYYSVIASIEDGVEGISDDDWITVSLDRSQEANNGIVLEKAFVRNENGNHYVYVSEDGVLKKRYIEVKKIVNGGYSYLIGRGLRKTDLIAFPYGDSVTDGAPVTEVSSSEIYGWGD